MRDRKACIHQTQNLDKWEAFSKTVIIMGFKIMLGICLPEKVFVSDSLLCNYTCLFNGICLSVSMSAPRGVIWDGEKYFPYLCIGNVLDYWQKFRVTVRISEETEEGITVCFQ